VTEGDEALVAAVRDGSERAFNELVDRHQQAVRTFLRGITAYDDADDMAQETFLAVWTHARSYRGGNVRAWLFSIAWRKAKGAQRSWFRRRRRDSEYHGSPAPTRDMSAEDRLAVRQALACCRWRSGPPWSYRLDVDSPTPRPPRHWASRSAR
jgi:RNA polymerase sigma-70 factor (ECF subfamily)